MATAITAKMGLDLGPLKKGLTEAQKLEQAAQKKALSLAKAHADEVSKVAAEAANKAGEAHDKAADRLKNVGSSLNSLESGLEGIGDALGLGVVGAFAVKLVTGIHEARNETHELERDLSFLGKKDLNAGNAGADVLAQRRDAITDKLSEEAEKKRKAEQEFILGTVYKNSASNSFFGAGFEILHDIGAYEVNGKTQGQEEEDAKTKDLLEQHRLNKEISAIGHEDVNIEEIRVQKGEAAAAAAEEELKSKREIASVEREITARNKNQFDSGGQADADILTGPLKRRSSLAQEEIARKDMEAKRAESDRAESIRKQTQAAINANYSKMESATEEEARLADELAKETRYSNETDNEDRKRMHAAKAAELYAQLRLAQEHKNQIGTQIGEQTVDLARAYEQSQINILSITNRRGAALAQIKLNEQKIADNAERAKGHDEARRMELAKQNLELEEQNKKIKIAEALKTPNQRREERRADAHARRIAERVDRADRLHPRGPHAPRPIAADPQLTALKAMLSGLGLSGDGIARAVVTEVLKNH
jgi:hypothetical protein